MKIAIASGKGGTGKTTVATNLALVSSRSGEQVQLLDCDVEEPNCHLFLSPELTARYPVEVPVPRVDPDLCTGCGTCAEVCEFGAIACLNGQVLVFDALCHGCGGCRRFCPAGAIQEVGREIGVVEEGRAGDIAFVRGVLNVTEAMAPPVVQAVGVRSTGRGVALFDAPPGTSCPVVETLRGVDFVLLTTEPTPFGRNDLELAVEMVRVLDLPFGVVVNRCDVGDRRVHEYCAAQGIDILLELPDDRRVAEAYSRGQMAVEALPEYGSSFQGLLEQVRSRCESPGSCRPGPQDMGEREQP